MNSMAQDMLIERLNDSVITYDLLRVVQAYSEISKDFPKLFWQLEQIFNHRFDQLSVDEITTCASGFSISGYGSPVFIKRMEQAVMMNLKDFNNTSLKEIAKGFVFCMRASKLLLQMLLPRF